MSNGNIQAVEDSLLTAVSIHGIPKKSYNLVDRMKYFHVPGVSIAVINTGNIEWARGYGVLEMNGNQQVSPDTLFQAASISKPVSAMMALRLAEQGKLDLDSDVNKFLSSWQIPENEYTEKNKVTLRGILSHTAGLTVHGFPGYGFDTEVPSLLQILNGELPANSAPIRVDVAPGSMFRYSGGGYTVMQQILEDISDKTFDELLQTEVLDNLNMHSSTFEQPLPMQLREKAATGHVGAGLPIRGKWHTYPEIAAAGLWTTPTDLANFAIEIMKSCENRSNKILSASMVNSMLTSVQEGYGLGFAVKKLGNNIIRFGHSGGNEGFRCYLVAYTGNGKGAVVMTNSDNGDNLMMEIVRSISNIYEWSDFLPIEKQVVQVNPNIYSQYAGKYQHPDYPDFVVQVERDGSHLLFEPIQGTPRWEGYPESETKYFFVESEAGVEFQKNNDGIFDALILFSMRLEKIG
jgi:CubicO group peptidase (beta-lactamase class C family)